MESRRVLCRYYHGDPEGPGLERGAEGQAVVERAKGVNAVEVVGAGEAPGRGAGGDDEAVVGQVLAAGEQHLTGGEVETRCRGAGAPLDAQVVERADGRGQRCGLRRADRKSTRLNSSH